MKKKKSIRFLFVILFIVLLPIFIIGFIFKSLIKTIKYIKFKKNKYTINDFLNNAYIEKIDIMQGYEFECFLKMMFFYLGYDVKTTTRTGDFGADLVLKKDGVTTVVQAKRYNKNVGSKSVQEVVSAIKHYNATQSIVITNSYFTKQAEQVAKEHDVALVDRHGLVNFITEAKQKIEKTYNIKTIDNDITDNVKANAMLDENFDNKYRFRI